MTKTASLKKTKSSTSGKLINYIVELLSQSLNSTDTDKIKETLNNCRSHIDNIITRKSPKTKKKDPNYPKRGKSSYIFFCIDNREKIHIAQAELSAKEIIRELGKKWRNLSSNSKKKYEELAVKDKKRYEKELSEYIPSAEFNIPVKAKAKKRSMSSYLFFCQEQRPLVKKKHTEYNTKEITAELGKRWRELTDKSPYQKMAQKEKERLSMPCIEEKEKKEESEVKSKKSGGGTTTKKRSKSGYSIYFKMNKEPYEEEGLLKKEINTKLRALWKTLSSEEKDVYRKKYSRG